MLQKSHVAWSVCVCVFLCMRDVQKQLNWSTCRLGDWLTWFQVTMYLMGVHIPHEKGHFWGGYVLADCNVSTHRCIHCALIACHRRRRTNAFAICTARSEKTVMWPLAKLPWTFVNVKRYYNQYVLIITSAQINLAKGSIAVLSPIAASNAFVRRVQAHSYDTWDICSNRPHLCIACRRYLIIYARWFTPKWGVLIKGQIVRPFTFS